MTFGAIGGAVLGSVASTAVSGLFGGGGDSSSQASAAADPFASQRGQYQALLQQLMTGKDSAGKAAPFSSSDPSYAFRFQQGEQAIDRSLGAKGLLNSGQRLTALNDYGQGMASTEYANEFSRLSQLAGANVGSPAAAAQIMAGTQQANQQSVTALGGAFGKAVSGWFNTPSMPADVVSGWSGIGSSGTGFGVINDGVGVPSFTW